MRPMNEQAPARYGIVYVYVGLVLLALLQFFAAVAENNALGGLFVMLLTLPWSFAASQLLAAVVPDLFERVWVGPAIVLLSGAINVAIMVRWARRSSQKQAR